MNSFITDSDNLALFIDKKVVYYYTINYNMTIAYLGIKRIIMFGYCNWQYDKLWFKENVGLIEETINLKNENAFWLFGDEQIISVITK